VATAHNSFFGISGASCGDSVPTGHLVKDTRKAGVDGGRCVQAQSLPFRRPLVAVVGEQMEIPSTRSRASPRGNDNGNVVQGFPALGGSDGSNTEWQQKTTQILYSPLQRALDEWKRRRRRQHAALAVTYCPGCNSVLAARKQANPEFV
jgi:hypothetical protein